MKVLITDICEREILWYCQYHELFVSQSLKTIRVAVNCDSIPTGTYADTFNADCGIANSIHSLIKKHDGIKIIIGETVITVRPTREASLCSFRNAMNLAMMQDKRYFSENIDCSGPRVSELV